MTANANGTLNWRTINNDLEFRSPILPELIAFWEAARPGPLLPGRAAFDAVDLLRFKGHISLVEIERNPQRFRFRLVGTAITEMLGRDSTGLYLDQLYSAETYDLAVAGYRYCVDTGLPAKASGQMVHANKEYVQFESVDLPLATDGTTVDMILKGSDFIR